MFIWAGRVVVLTCFAVVKRYLTPTTFAATVWPAQLTLSQRTVGCMKSSTQGVTSRRDGLAQCTTT